MDLIDKSHQSLYESCKYKVKVWEHKFKKSNGRLPSKLDIKEAEPEVRSAYKTYFNLKTAALEQSFMDVDGFNSDEERSTTESNPINSTVISDEKLDDNVNVPSISDSTWGVHLNKKREEKIIDKPLPSPNLNLKISRKLSIGSKLIKRNPRKSLSQVKSESSINLSLRSKSPELNHIGPVSLSQPAKSPFVGSINSSESDMMLESLASFNPKNTKVVSKNILSASQPINFIGKGINQNKGKDLKFKNIDIEWLERIESSINLKKDSDIGITKIDSISDEDIIDNSDDETSNSAFHVAKKIKYVNSKITASQNTNNVDSKLSEDKNLDTTNCNEVTEICLSELSNQQNDCNEINYEKKENYVIEVNKKLEKCEKNQDKKLDVVKRSENKECDDELIAKFKGKNLNQNFVRINLKKKIYARGKKTQTFSKFKKKMWKNKKKFLAESNDVSIGNKNKWKSGKLLPLDDILVSEDEDHLVTLDQASGRVVSAQVPQEYSTVSNGNESEDDMTLAQIKERIVIGKKESGMGTVKNKQEIRKQMENDDNIRKEIVNEDSSQPELKVAKTKKVKKKVEQKTKIKQLVPSSNSDIVPKSKKSGKVVKGETNKTRSKYFTAERNKVVRTKVNSKTKITADKFIADPEEEEHPTNYNVNEHLFDADEDLDLLLESARIEHTLNVKEIYPLFDPNEDGSLIKTPERVYEALRLFGHESFRDGQEQAVMRILSGKSTLVTLSTGTGKSLCYQLPAYLFRQKYRCITLVISPLISLMEDQVKCIPGVLNAACLHGYQSKTQRELIIKSIASGEVGVLMVSPESILSSESSRGFGAVLAQLPPIAFACLDEAHCLSQWSHNFRPSYLVVCRILQETLGVKTILGLTATATRATRTSLIKQLKIPDGENGVIKDTPVPSNLSLSVSRDVNKDRALLDLLLSEPFVDFNSIIIYCLRRDECEKVASFLRTTLKEHVMNDNSKKRKRMSSQAEPYHAGLSGARRKAVQKSFMSGELRIVVATIAFGMGINKSDLRSVIHYNMPAKFESYVQEIGRAGRDGLPAHCHAFLNRQNTDVFELRRHIYGNSVDRHIIRKLLRKVFISCNCKGPCDKHEVLFSMDSTVKALNVSQEILSTLLCYIELEENKYIKMLKPAYGNCKILSYGGAALINKAAETCKPVEVALKLYGDKNDESSNCLEFPVLDIARALNFDSGMCKRLLRELEWCNVNGRSKRSGLTIEFSDLCFHLLSPGNLPDEDLDAVLDSLYTKVLEQENSAYSQLIHIAETLMKVASLTFRDSLSENEDKSEILKQDIRDYFESDKPLEVVDLPEISEQDKNVVLSDVRAIVSKYCDEVFTGRSIARIFHGIPSPNYPPYTWGRTNFWRRHLPIHFNHICKIATSELIKMQ